MSNFEVPVVQVDEVYHHPNADRLDVVRIGGYTTISAKLEDGSPRYNVGDLVVYIPENSVLPEWLLKELDLWDNNKNKGMLSGSQGNRLRPKRLRGIFSEGMLYPVYIGFSAYGWEIHNYETQNEPKSMIVFPGDNVAEFLGITKWEPQVPATMVGRMSGEYINFTVNYDFESLKKRWTMFEEGEWVRVTEKIHGCLSAGSLVMLPNGEEIPIHKVIDDKIEYVLSYDEATKGYIPRKITGTSKRPNTENKKWIRLTFEGGKCLTLTEDHPVYSRDRESWIEAKNILENEDIESPID